MVNSAKKFLKKHFKGPYDKMADIKNILVYYVGHKKKQIHSYKYRYLPLEDKVVFLNFEGKGYGCNPKYIAEELLKRGFTGELVWLVTCNDPFMPANIRQVKIDCEDSFKELATAKVIINNVKGDINLKKRVGQYYIQTWHAGFSPKLLEKDASSSLSKAYLLESKHNSQSTDLFLSNSIAQTEEYKRAFWCSCEILEKGLPRNDVFFNYNKTILSQIKNKLGIKSNCKVLMYAPTFRNGNDSFEDYKFDYRLIGEKVKAKFGGEWVIMIRMHPNISASVKFDVSYIDVSKYPDMQDLLLITDILVTDYSSSLFDIIEMNKIAFIYSNDITQYQSIRGLKPEFFKLPIPIAENNEALSKNISDFNYENYIEDIDEMKKKYCTFDQGNAASSVADKIIRWIEKE